MAHGSPVHNYRVGCEVFHVEGDTDVAIRLGAIKDCASLFISLELAFLKLEGRNDTPTRVRDTSTLARCMFLNVNLIIARGRCLVTLIAMDMITRFN